MENTNDLFSKFITLTSKYGIEKDFLYMDGLSVEDIKKMIEEDRKLLDKRKARNDAINDIQLRYIAQQEANKV